LISTRIKQFASQRIVDHIHMHGQLDTMHTHSHTMHTCVRCESRVRIGRVTIIVHDPAAGVKEHVLSWRCMLSIILFVSKSRAFRVMQCLPIVAARSILRWNQFSNRQKRGRQSDYGNGNETAKFTKNHQILSRIKVRWETLMGFWR
jgi:hypothetical protein